jgi:hypothetical protein
MLFLHVAQLVMSFTTIHHLTSIIASIDMGGAQHAIHAFLGNAACPQKSTLSTTGSLTQLDHVIGDAEVVVEDVSGGTFVFSLGAGAIIIMLPVGERTKMMGRVCITSAIIGFFVFLTASGVQTYMTTVFGCG